MKELRMRDVSYVYRQGKHEMPVFSGVNLTLEAGRLYVVTGSAGSGRTTLLQLLAGLIAPETGWLELDGRRVRRWQISRYRRDVATMLFEKNNLMMQADVAENIAMPLRIQGKSRARAVQEALGFLDSVALPRGIASMTPAMLSGGDQQRVGKHHRDHPRARERTDNRDDQRRDNQRHAELIRAIAPAHEPRKRRAHFIEETHVSKPPAYVEAVAA